MTFAVGLRTLNNRYGEVTCPNWESVCKTALKGELYSSPVRQVAILNHNTSESAVFLTDNSFFSNNLQVVLLDMHGRVLTPKKGQTIPPGHSQRYSVLPKVPADFPGGLKELLERVSQRSGWLDGEKHLVHQAIVAVYDDTSYLGYDIENIYSFTNVHGT